MDFELALRARLRASDAVRAIVDDAVDWVERPQAADGGGYPAIVLQSDDDTRARTMMGVQGWRRPEVRIDCMARTFAQKRALREAVIATLQRSAVFDGGRFGRAQDVRVRDLSEDTGTDFIHRDQVVAYLPYLLET